MMIEIKDLKNSNNDKELLELFYKSVFFNRKEFEYYRLPKNFFDRYQINKDYSLKGAFIENKLVATLGVLYCEGILDDKKTRIGFFVDNNIDPDYAKYYQEVFDELFKQMNKELEQSKTKILIGWDYKEKIKNEKSFFEKNFVEIPNFNWFPGGHDLSWGYNEKEHAVLSNSWVLGLKLYNIKHKIIEFFNKKDEELIISEYKHKDLGEVTKFLNTHDKTELSEKYSKQSLNKKIKDYELRGLIAKKKNKVVGVILFFISSWSGAMVGKPFYDKKHDYFLTWTPTDFVVTKNNSKIGTRLLLELMHKKGVRKLEHNNQYTFIVELFDTRIKWKKEAYLNAGCDEPAYDYGSLLIYKNSAKINKNKKFNIPNNFVVSPVIFDRLDEKTKKRLC